MKTRMSLVLFLAALALIVVFGALPALPVKAASASPQESPKYDASVFALTARTPLTSVPFLPFVLPEEGGLRIVSPITPTVSGVPVTSTLSGDYFYPTGAGRYTVEVNLWPYTSVAVDYELLAPGEIYSDDAILLEAQAFTVTFVRYLNNPLESGRVYALKGWNYVYQDNWQYGLRTDLWDPISRAWGTGKWEQYTTVKLSGEAVCDKGLYGFVASLISVGLCGTQDVSIDGVSRTILSDDTGRFDRIAYTPVVSGMSIVLTNTASTVVRGRIIYASNEVTVTAHDLSVGSSRWPLWLVAYDNRLVNITGAAYAVDYDYGKFRLEGVCDSGWCEEVSWGYFTTLRLRQVRWTISLPLVLR